MSIEDRLCYLTILCLVSASDTYQITNCSEEAIIHLSNLYLDPYSDNSPYTKAQGCLKRFIDNKMITLDNEGALQVCNFMKRQGQNLTSYERVKRYRDKQKVAKNKDKVATKNVINDNASDNANDNARSDKKRIEQNTIRERATRSNENVDFFEKEGKQEEVVSYLKEKGIDETLARREVIKFVDYWLEKSGTGKARWQGEKYFELKRRLGSWFSRVGQGGGKSRGKQIIGLENIQ